MAKPRTSPTPEQGRIEDLLRRAKHPMGRIVPTAARSCDGKTKYTMRLATIVAKQQSLKCGDALEAYACRFCSAWHIGHAPRPVA